jgi:DNA helicase-2/ATP-dependent DNA helicase PcrA
VPGRALADYISRVLPDLGLRGVPVRTLPAWLRRQRARAIPKLARFGSDPEHEDLEAVSRLKKHPEMLTLIEGLTEARRAQARDALFALAEGIEQGALVKDAWSRLQPGPLALQLRGLLEWLRQPLGSDGGRLRGRSLAEVEVVIRRLVPRPDDLLQHWAELLTDRERLGRLSALGGESLSAEDLDEAVRHCITQTAGVLDLLEARDYEPDDERTGGEEEVERAELSPGGDGSLLPYLSCQDDALLLCLYQRLIGPLPADSGKRLTYAHVFVDEVQDLSVVELSALLGCLAPGAAVTLAGDPAQRMVFDTGYRDWTGLLGALGQDSVAIEPLRIGYRSTAEIQRFAQLVLGPRWEDEAPRASRPGVPVEAFHFSDPGEAVVFLADALRELGSQEPLASVALITRYPAQADSYYRALRAAEVAGLRRVVDQGFSFTPGIEITDVRQVKGLEFDYVLLLDVTAESYPDTEEARHLLHIASTRAAHQLWLIVPGRPSPVIESIGSS